MLVDRTGRAASCWRALPVDMALTPGDIAVAALTLDTGEPAGRGVRPVNLAEWQFHPVASGEAVMAAIGPRARRRRCRRSARTSLPLLDNLLDQVALALERGRLEREAREFAAHARARPGALGAALLDRGGPQAAARTPSPAPRARCGASGSGDKALVADSRVRSRASSTAMSTTSSTSAPAPTASRSRSARSTIDLYRRSVSRDGEEVHLTPKEYAVLAELAKHAGRVLDARPSAASGLGTGAGSSRSIICASRCGAPAKARARSRATGADRQRAGGRLSPRPSSLNVCEGR